MRCIRFDVCNQEIWYTLYPSTHVFYMLIYFAKHRITLLPLLPLCCTTHLLNCLRLCFASSRMCPTLVRFGLLDGCLHNCWRITSQTPTFPIKLIPQANVIVFFFSFWVSLTDVIRHSIRKYLMQHTAITFYTFKTHTYVVTYSQSHKI